MTGREATRTCPNCGVEWGPGEWHPDPCRARPEGREATWTVEAEGDNCPLCNHGPEAHDGEGCSATEGYDHLNGFHECGCPLTPPAPPGRGQCQQVEGHDGPHDWFTPEPSPVAVLTERLAEAVHGFTALEVESEVTGTPPRFYVRDGSGQVFEVTVTAWTCQVCGAPLSAARSALGLTLCSGLCHQAANRG